MPVIRIELPEEIFSALRSSPEEFTHALRLAAAMHWYSRGMLLQEKAATLAGLDRTDFLDALARERVDVFSVDFNQLQDELDRG